MAKGQILQKKHLPVELVYAEEFARIEEAFYREKQIQGWSRKKKEALIAGNFNKLHELAECKNETKSVASAPFDSAQGTAQQPACSLSGVEMRSVSGVEPTMKIENYKNFVFGDVLSIVNGKNQRTVEDKNGTYPIYRDVRRPCSESYGLEEKTSF